MSDPLDAVVDAKIRAIRDSRRPPIEAVVTVMERIFAEMAEDVSITQVQAGPTTWIWRDDTMRERRLEKFYILTGSAELDTLGYPLLTIRQVYSPQMDSWITASSLIVGNNETEIMQGISLMVANHLGAFSGFRYANNAAVAAGGAPRGRPRRREGDHGRRGRPVRRRPAWGRRGRR
jgi:hypothetical protein